MREQHGDPAGLQPGGERVGQRAHPAGDRPGAEVLLDVGPHAHPGRHVAQVVALERHRVARQLAQPLVLERLLDQLVQRQPGGEQRLGLLARVLGREGPLEPVPAQRLPVVGERVDVGRPAAAEPVAEGAVDGLDLGGAAAAGQVEHGPRRRRTGAGAPARPGPGRSPSPAAGRTCGTGRAAPPAAGCGSGRRPSGTRPARRSRARRRAASPASSRVTSWPILASRAALASPPYPPPITTTRAMALTLRGAAGFPG